MACWWGRSTLEMNRWGEEDDRGLSLRPETNEKKTHRYRGATAVAALDAPHSRPGDSILRVPKGWLPDCGFGDDAPRVRRPTCRCVYGRPPLLASAARAPSRRRRHLKIAQVRRGPGRRGRDRRRPLRAAAAAMEANKRDPRPRGPHRRRRPRAALRGVRGPLARRPRPALVRLLPRARARARAVLGRVLALLHSRARPASPTFARRRVDGVDAGQRRPRARDRRAVRGLRRPRAPRAVLARGRLDGRRGRGRAALRGPRRFASASGQHFASFAGETLVCLGVVVLPSDASKKKREDQTTKHAQARATATARARCPS